VVTLIRTPIASPITAPTTTKNHVPLACFVAPIPMPTILAALGACGQGRRVSAVPTAQGQERRASTRRSGPRRRPSTRRLRTSRSRVCSTQGRTLATASNAPRTLSERSVIAPITVIVMTASTTPYSAIVCPSSCLRSESAATCAKVKSFSI
jgi:hypothetical protein